MSWHPCNFTKCCENFGGQCFGGGCAINPAPERERDGDETENEKEN